MCFGPSAAEKQAAADARVEAEVAKRAEIEDKAGVKREDISDALTARSQGKGMRGGTGRKSLFSSGGQGFLGRFD